MKLLLNDERVDINKPNKNDWTPFHSACHYGYIEVVKLLLNDQRVDINKAASDGWTPFHSACYNGPIEVVKLLLNDKRIDINQANKFSETPFSRACDYGKTEVVKCMFESGREIDINKKDKHGWTGLDYAKQNRNPDIVELIESFQKRKENKGKFKGIFILTFFKKNNSNYFKIIKIIMKKKH